MFPHNYIQEVLDRNDVVDVVQGYVQLRHRGRTYTGLCPFHNEKTPSFVVYPDTQSFYCFGCGVGGDTINFIKRINNLDYTEAVKLLAARAGMPLPQEDDRTGQERRRILAMNKDAARYFYDQLNGNNPDAAQARAYWHKRGLSDSTIRRFGLGYAPNDFQQLMRYLGQRGYTKDEMLSAGLIKRSQKGNLHNTFWNRVMTPIFDLRGNVIAFGGRVLDDSKPKYVNSPETLVYKKSKTLFALNVAKKETSKRYILCEGYMDVISMHQAGYRTAVCACGTALTQEQVKLLSEYADQVVLAYDSDEAGQKATARSLELFKQSPIKVTVLNIPGAKDPDEFIKKNGAEAFRQLLDGSSNEVEYNLAKLRAKHDLTTDSGRVNYLQDAVVLLASGLTPTERDIYAGRIAEETNVSKAAVLNQLESTVRRVSGWQRRQKQKELQKEMLSSQIKVPYSLGGEKALAAVNGEQQVLAALLKDPQLFPRVAEQVGPEQFLMPEDRKLYEGIQRCISQGNPVTIGALGAFLEESEVTLAAQLLARNSDNTLTPKDIDLFLQRMKKNVSEPRQAPRSQEEMRQRLEALTRSKNSSAEN